MQVKLMLDGEAQSARLFFSLPGKPGITGPYLQGAFEVEAWRFATLRLL